MQSRFRNTFYHLCIDMSGPPPRESVQKLSPYRRGFFFQGLRLGCSLPGATQPVVERHILPCCRRSAINLAVSIMNMDCSSARRGLQANSFIRRFDFFSLQKKVQTPPRPLQQKGLHCQGNVSLSRQQQAAASAGAADSRPLPLSPA